MSEGINEYEKFMEWFKYEHPALHDKYGINISVPFKDGGGVTVTSMYKISHKEQDFVTYVSSCYYKKAADTPIDTIEFAYKEGVKQSDEREETFRGNITSWLKEISHLINRQRGVIKVLFIDHLRNIVSVENVDDNTAGLVKSALSKHES
jgi:hypothetical protein